MLDGCGIETIVLWRPRRHRHLGRDRCSMAVESRQNPEEQDTFAVDGRDRCSMAVESRPTIGLAAYSRWRGRDRCSMAMGSRLEASGDVRCEGLEVAIDARWLWDRDTGAAVVGADALRRDRCSWDRDNNTARAGFVRGSSSRSMLDGCGIETVHDKLTPTVEQVVAIDARCLWDRDTEHKRTADARLAVAIDARWLWDRDWRSRCQSRGKSLRHDRCSMTVGSRPRQPLVAAACED